MKTKANWKQTLAENIAMDFERVAEANNGTMTDEWVRLQAINAYGTFLSEADLVTVAGSPEAHHAQPRTEYQQVPDAGEGDHRWRVGRSEEII